MICLAVLPELKASQNLTLREVHALKMSVKLPKTLLKFYRLSLHKSIAVDNSPLSRVIPH